VVIQRLHDKEMSRYYPQVKKKGGETLCGQSKNSAEMDGEMP